VEVPHADEDVSAGRDGVVFKLVLLQGPVSVIKSDIFIYENA
jgi:hypothetical protein